MRKEQTTITCDRCNEQIVFSEGYNTSKHDAEIHEQGWQVIRVGFDPAISAKRHLCLSCYAGLVNYIEGGWMVTPDAATSDGSLTMPPMTDSEREQWLGELTGGMTLTQLSETADHSVP